MCIAGEQEFSRDACLRFLHSRLRALWPACPAALPSTDETAAEPKVDLPRAAYGVAPFFLPLGGAETAEAEPYAFDAPTTRANAFRILRALQVTSERPSKGS